MHKNFQVQHRSFAGTTAERIARMLESGMPKKTIARNLGISISTVKDAIEKRYGKASISFKSDTDSTVLTPEEIENRRKALLMSVKQ